jgi:hypothetical protein
LLSIEAPIVLPTKSIGQQFSDTVFFPTARGSCWFLLTPTLSLQHFIFRCVRHYKDSFFLLLWFCRCVRVTRTFASIVSDPYQLNENVM